MKPVAIGFQKRILFIPYVNVLILFIWLYNNLCLYKWTNTLPKTGWILLSSTLPLEILNRLAGMLFQPLGTVLGYLNVYLMPLVIGWRLIKYQEELKQ